MVLTEAARTAAFQAQREGMIRTQLADRGIHDLRVLAAMREVPRHEFVAESFQADAYEDHPLPIGDGQTISQPYIVAIMLQHLSLQPADRVFEVGAGSGYVTALLSRLCAEVYSVERYAELGIAAKAKLERLGYVNVKIRAGDGSQGCPEHAPFNAILVSAATPAVPPVLFTQLCEAGRMILPVGPPSSQQLQLVRKLDGHAVVTELEGCRFVPLIEGAELQLPARGSRRAAFDFSDQWPLAAALQCLVGFFQNLKVTLEMIKWEHSIFALPFALCGAMLAAGGFPAWRPLAWIVVAMVSARSAAMAFNRLADASIDAANPRTAIRALPTGQLTPSFVTTFVFVSCGVFVFAASQLNRLTLVLSPVALGVLLLYSYSKRFTRCSHLLLGLALGIAPAAAWIAIRGSLDPRILLLTAAVTFWVGGFDVIYACQDYHFDRSYGLHSLPRHLGIHKALWIARVFHLLMLGLLVALAVAFHLGGLAVMGVIAVAGLLAYEHVLVRHDDLSKHNAAFFTMNGVISVVYFLFMASDLILKP